MTNKKQLIDVNALIAEYDRVHIGKPGGARKLMVDASIIDAVEVRHGYWIEKGYVCGETEYECSECKETEWRTNISRFKYCPFCGAYMDKKINI